MGNHVTKRGKPLKAKTEVVLISEPSDFLHVNARPVSPPVLPQKQPAPALWYELLNSIEVNTEEVHEDDAFSQAATDVCALILSMLSVRDLCRVQQTNRFWYNMGKINRIWRDLTLHVASVEQWKSKTQLLDMAAAEVAATENGDVSLVVKWKRVCRENYRQRYCIRCSQKYRECMNIMNTCRIHSGKRAFVRLDLLFNCHVVVRKIIRETGHKIAAQTAVCIGERVPMCNFGTTTPLVWGTVPFARLLHRVLCVRPTPLPSASDRQHQRVAHVSSLCKPIQEAIQIDDGTQVI
eukprot:TRINITY_DN7860_c0_g2_i3.p1 TRINITY_DN7860_c0_g2~~TRINITY_DN7860_c0_g2_i3.p1  ORF type:complete len:325 (-),score=-4.10 TRINITY_DN7860_c0_g2_i3:115-996(-)